MKNVKRQTEEELSYNLKDAAEAYAKGKRWGPCPKCKATGWKDPIDPPLPEHNRPQGGKCSNHYP